VSLDAATEDIIHRLSNAVKPCLVAGPKLLTADAIEEFCHLANAIGCGVATLPNAKSYFCENHPLYMGTYWAGISSPHVREIVESCDLIIIAGAVLNDYVTCGWTALLPPKKMVDLQTHEVTVCKRLYSGVNMGDLLSALAAKAPMKESSLQAYRRYKSYEGELPPMPPAERDTPLTLRELRRQLQDNLTPLSSLIVETGDSWFIGQYLKLPDGAKYHWQMQYGSIGWSVGAALGVALGVDRTRRPILLVGDGSFQMTAQEVSTMIRYRCKITIILINNRGYTIEVQIHDGPYNDIKNWDYAGLMDVFNAGEGNGLGLKARTGGELMSALAKADKHDGVTLIEAVTDRDDCTAQLLEFGSKVSSANMRA
jgi:TPP-dependent 2-oxoacid decarboxylase